MLLERIKKGVHKKLRKGQAGFRPKRSTTEQIFILIRNILEQANEWRAGLYVRFEHPFTSMIAGMTGSGKTAWVRSLLQQASETIYPPPERIVWCYSQWQPAYTEMLVAMPHIEFVKGIPTALEQDSYFDVNKRNLIVFDDQMIDASKDKRIVNLFTRGSHHRNLSVIYIVQNLFHQGKGSRSISLNSHYLVLLKNPQDKLQILTLAKQMYPGQTDFFINQCEKAVKRPFWLSAD